MCRPHQWQRRCRAPVFPRNQTGLKHYMQEKKKKTQLSTPFLKQGTQSEARNQPGRSGLSRDLREEKEWKNLPKLGGEPEEPSLLAPLQQGLPRCFGNGPVERDSARLGLASKDQQKEARAVLRGDGICHGAQVLLYAERGRVCGRDAGAQPCGHGE